MGADQNIDWRATAASALEWWRDAGVDTLVDDLPRDWLAAPAPPATPAALVAEPVSTRLPDNLAAFLAWRIGPEAVEANWAGGMLAAEGPLDARLMVMVDCPERDDARGGRLMSGPAGVLFDRMLAAIGTERAAIHLASVCAARPSGGRVAGGDEATLGALARHHAALAAPDRLLVLGNGSSRAIFGMDLDEARGGLRALNHGGRTVAVVASYHPRLLIEKPALKAEAWKDLQMLIGTTL